MCVFVCWLVCVVCVVCVGWCRCVAGCGVLSARPSSAICHETIRRDLEGITGALNIADNILVWGCGDTEEDAVKEHDKALNDVFLMFRRNGLTINPKKSVFSATRTKFFGYVFPNTKASKN